VDGDHTTFAEVISYIETNYTQFFPFTPFEFSVLDNQIENMYIADKKLSTIFTYFTLLAIVIACLGLYGLSLFISKCRTKEIGIRKVLGASAHSITYLLSRDVLKWIVVASLIGCPIGWYVMQRWLQNYAYRTNLNIGIFVLAVASAIVIALLTVSFKSVQTALANPVDSLRNE
jgi:putative ABC transport system permease protein